jgi:Ca2+-binding RTX toxin-like protein
MGRRTRMPLAVLAVSMLLVVMAAGAALAITKTCTGNNDYCFGTANPDTIYDGPGSDIINARAGGDVVRADNYYFEYDEVYGGRGADRIHAVDDFDDTGYYFDRINGGRGYDIRNVDEEDKVSNCVVVRRR